MGADFPDGFVLTQEFLTETEERSLIEYIRTAPYGSVRMHGVTAKRRVDQFGWRYSFEGFQLTPRRSMYLLTGAARQQWQHTIPAVRELRRSITFRTVRGKKAAA